MRRKPSRLVCVFLHFDYLESPTRLIVILNSMSLSLIEYLEYTAKYGRFELSWSCPLSFFVLPEKVYNVSGSEASVEF